MFLHLIHFDPKFPALIAKVFETAMPGKNIFVLVGSTDGKTECLPGFHWVSTASELREVLAGYPNLRGAILNGLLSGATDLLPVLPADLPVGWVIWGHEYYADIPGSRWNLIGPMTRKISGWNISHEFKDRVLRLLLKPFNENRRRDNLLRRISTVATCSASEFNLLQNCFPALDRAALISVPVMYLEDLVDTKEDFVASDCGSAQVGNSAFVTNNHLEAFHVLKRDLPNCQKVIAPLSYGDPRYRDAVIERGRNLFGRAFEPWVEFMALDQYNSLMRDCSLVVLNSYRQQGVGNILSALWRGARVYLAARDLCNEFKSWGLSVWHVDKDTPLQFPDASEIAENASKNRAILMQRMGQASASPKVRKWLEGMTRVSVP